MEKRYFAASNSGKGFVSYFDDIFSPERFERIYIIKGGPGTGKSRFMRSVAERAESLGRGVEYYYCSSDRESLDGIIIEGDSGGIALVDGTAPHSAECTLPGAVESIIDLGVFWDAGRLGTARREIERLNDEKKRGYKRAYGLLSAYSDVSETIDTCFLPLFDREKAEKYILGRLKPRKKDREVYRKRIAIRGSVGMRGRSFFDTLEKNAERIVKIDDSLGVAHILLEVALGIAERNALRVTVSYDPIDCDHLDAVLFEGRGLIFESAERGQVKMTRFLTGGTESAVAAARRKIKSSMGLREALLCEATDELAEVGRTHFELEEIYKGAMDFEAKERFERDFIRGLFG